MLTTESVGHLVHTIAKQRVCTGIFSTTLYAYRSAIYPQGMAYKYGLEGKLPNHMKLGTPRYSKDYPKKIPGIFWKAGLNSIRMLNDT